jgi:hypothetical protein
LAARTGKFRRVADRPLERSLRVEDSGRKPMLGNQSVLDGEDVEPSVLAQEPAAYVVRFEVAEHEPPAVKVDE